MRILRCNFPFAISYQQAHLISKFISFDSVMGTSEDFIIIFKYKWMSLKPQFLIFNNFSNNFYNICVPQNVRMAV